jgi:hypothetical protein
LTDERRFPTIHFERGVRYSEPVTRRLGIALAEME